MQRNEAGAPTEGEVWATCTDPVAMINAAARAGRGTADDWGRVQYAIVGQLSPATLEHRPELRLSDFGDPLEDLMRETCMMVAAVVRLIVPRTLADGIRSVPGLGPTP